MSSILLLAACAPAPPRTPPLEPAVAAAVVPGAAVGGLFLQGFAVRWEERPHRLRRLGFEASGEALPDAPLVGALRAEARGGSWSDGRKASDRPMFAVRYGAVASGDLRATLGSVHLDVVGTRGRDGRSPASGEATVHVPLPPEVALAPVAVWLTGFTVDTAPSHPDGFTPQALAVELGPPRAEAGGVTFDVRVRCDAAPVLDRRQQLAAWGASFDVGWLLVAAPGGEVRRVEVERARDLAVLPNETPGNREPLRVPLHAALDPGLAVPIAGLSGFTLSLDETGPATGRYLRALAVGVEDERYDPGRGAFDALVGLQFSNFGAVPRRVHVEARAAVTVLQPASPADVRRGAWTPPPSGFAHVASYPDLAVAER